MFPRLCSDHRSELSHSGRNVEKRHAEPEDKQSYLSHGFAEGKSSSAYFSPL